MTPDVGHVEGLAVGAAGDPARNAALLHVVETQFLMMAQVTILESERMDQFLPGAAAEDPRAVRGEGEAIERFVQSGA